jgi:HEAT repeat protein
MRRIMLPMFLMLLLGGCGEDKPAPKTPLLTEQPAAAADAVPQPPAPELVHELLTWSVPFNGLGIRMESFDADLARNGQVIFVALKNVGSKPLRVPTGNRKGAVFFELHAEGVGPWYRVQWNPEPDNAGDRPRVLLKPGQRALCYLAGAFGARLRRNAYRVKITLRVKPGKEKDAWQGTLETPVRRVKLNAAAFQSFAGRLPLPDVIPRFSRVRYMGGNMSGSESQFRCLRISNWNLVRQLNLYRPVDVARRMEALMAAEKDVHMKLLLAAVAMGHGSAKGKAVLLECRKSTDMAVVLSTLGALGSVLSAGKKAPEWAIDEAIAALNDKRKVTKSRSTWLGPAVAYLAEEDAGLPALLAHTRSRKAVPALMGLVKAKARRSHISALGDLGDNRAVPVLMEVVRKQSKKASIFSGTLCPDSLEYAIRALGRLKAKEALPLLAKNLYHRVTVEALERIGDPSVLPALRKIVADKRPRQIKGSDDDSRKSCVGAAKIAIATLQGGDPIPRYIALLDDKSLGEFKRREIVWRLGRKPDPRAIPRLLKAAKSDPSGAVVDNAIGALGEFRYPAAVTGLIACFDADFKGKANWKYAHRPEMFREHIGGALQRITGMNFGVDKKLWLRWWRKGVKGVVPDKNDPTWEELKSFLGVKKNDKRFQAFARKYGLSEYTKGPSGGFNRRGHSASLLYRQNKFTRIIIQPLHYVASFRPYTGKLPHGLTRKSTRADVLKKFAKPTYVQDKDVLHFSQHKLGFSFLNDRIGEITLDHK